MQKLVVKTVRGTYVLESPPNGGWAWIVTISAFVAFGSAWGIAKTQGIFFVDIKNEFAISNTAVSWLLTVVLSTLTFSGLLGKLMLRWFDARQMIMFGGLLSCVGMATASLASHFSILCFAAVLAGMGFGLSSILAMAQVSLYFSTWRPMANGIALSGSTILGIVFPYLNRYLLDEYGWRGAYLVSGGIALNTCAAGALIRPIFTISESSNNVTSTGDESRSTAQPSTSKLMNNAEMTSNSAPLELGKDSEKTDTIKENNSRNCVLFLERYWLAFGFLFANFLLSLSMFAPNVFIVPYAEEMQFTVVESTLLLSLISVGDFVGRVGGGFAVSKISLLTQNVYFGISTCILLLALTQFVAINFSTFSVTAFYATIYGVIFGTLTTMSVSFVGQALNPKTVESGLAALFASGGLGILAGGPIAGTVVDYFGRYQVIFWYTMISLLVCGGVCTLLSILVHRRGKLI